jgi:drug/metabolite transporter (DMT)-like permease
MLYAFIMPIVSVTLGWLVLGEQFRPQTLIGTGVVLSSVIVALRK